MIGSIRTKSSCFLLSASCAASIMRSAVAWLMLVFSATAWGQVPDVNDTFAIERERLIRNVLIPGGIRDQRVLDSVAKTLRHEFVPPKYVRQAYLDIAIPIGESQTISSPFIVSLMTEALAPRATDKVLEIGTGSGVISLCCAQAGANRIVSTDVNTNAVECARVNAQHLGFESIMDVRLVDMANAKAFAVVGEEERFDIIISNPPWEEGEPKSIDQYALYDPNFELMKSLLRNAPAYLMDDGQLYLAYGCKTAIQLLENLAVELGYEIEVLDDRKLEDLEEVFLPGMLLKLTLS